MGLSSDGDFIRKMMTAIDVSVVNRQRIKPIVEIIKSKLLVVKITIAINDCVIIDLYGVPFLLLFTKNEKNG
jgi:hypothetical protein